MAVPELFQQDDDKPTLDLGIEVVNVRKAIEGRWTSIPRQYTILEMSTEVQLFNELGPGSYELIGRNQKGQIVRRPKLVLAPPPGWAPPTPVQSQQQPVAQAPIQAMGGDTQLTVAIIQLMGQQMQMTAQMVTGMMTMNGQNANAHVQAMGQMFTNFANAQSSLLDKVMAKTSGADPQDLFLKGVETAADIQRGANDAKGDGDSGGSLAETVAAVAQGVQLAQSVGLIGSPGGAAASTPS
jgi:hypothetical protein